MKNCESRYRNKFEFEMELIYINSSRTFDADADRMVTRVWVPSWGPLPIPPQDFLSVFTVLSKARKKK